MWILTLANLYLLMSLFTYSSLKRNLFQTNTVEIYEFALSIERIKLCHSLLLLFICGLILKTIFNEEVITLYMIFSLLCYYKTDKPK